MGEELKPIVLVDCDGVLADFVGAFLEEVAHLTGSEHTHEEVTEWDIEKAPFFEALVQRLGLPFVADVWARMNAPGMARSLEPLPGSVRGMKDLSAIAEIYIVTSPMSLSPTWAHEREQWLHRHYGIPSSNVIHARKKHLVRGDVLVDDRLVNVADWVNATDGWGILWDMPHNRKQDVTKEHMRTADWREVVRLVGELRSAL